MELFLTVGLPITCFVFGVVIGKAMAQSLVNKVMVSGISVGSQITIESLKAQGLIKDTSENLDNDEEKMQFGFNLKGEQQ